MDTGPKKPNQHTLPSLTIRALLGGDLSMVSRIEQRSYKSPWNREALEYALNGGYECIGGFSPDQQLAGFIISQRVLEELHVLDVAVDPNWRRRGVAKRLLEHLHRTAKRAGVKVVHLEVGRSNLAAQMLYQNFGYRQVGSRKAYYQDNQEDALLMTLPLDS